MSDTLMKLSARLAALERQREFSLGKRYAQTGGRGRGTAGTATFLAKLLEPTSDYSDDRYYFEEWEAIDVDDEGKVCMRAKPSGRTGVLSNIPEWGVTRYDASGSASSTDTPCTMEQSGSGSGSLPEGTQYGGFHGALNRPSRAAENVRFVQVTARWTRNGKQFYTAETVPGAIIPKSYAYDATCLSETCPEGEWWKGHVIMSVEDDSAGDDMPECS